MSLEQVRIVLVRPQGAANIGAVARAMKNMGLKDLVLVAARAERSFWARAMAVHARDVLERTRTVATLGEAVGDCGLVVGTTCRGGVYRMPTGSARQLAPSIVASAGQNRVAIVFGPEDHGLSNEDLKWCHRLLTIPASAEYPSLNLAQAVMVVCYELFLASLEGQGQIEPRWAEAERVEFLFQRLKQAFLRIGFLHESNPDHILFALRRIFGRAGLEERDVKILLGLARQIEWYGNGGWQVRERASQRPAECATVEDRGFVDGDGNRL